MPVNLIFPKIIQAYMQGRNLKMQGEQQAKDNQFREEQQAERIRQFDENARLHQDQFKQQQIIQQAQLRLAQAEAKRRIQQGIGEGIIPGTPVGEDEIEVQDPELGVIRGPSPQAIAKRKGIFATQATADKVKELEATLPVLDEVAKKKEERAQKRAIEIQEMRSKSAHDLMVAKANNQLSLEHLRGRYRVNAALAKGTKLADLGNEDIETGANDALKGIYSLEDLPKLYPDKKIRSQVIHRVMQNGGRILNEKETIDLKNLTALNGYIRQIDEMHDAIEKAGSGLWLDPQALKDIYARGVEIEQGLGNLATTIGGQKGAISQKDVEAQKGNIPSLSPLANNQRRRRNLHAARDSKVNAILGNMPKKQRDAIMQEFQLEITPKKIDLKDPRFEIVPGGKP